MPKPPELIAAIDFKVLSSLFERARADKERNADYTAVEVQALSEQLALDQSQVAAACLVWQSPDKGQLLAVEERPYVELRLGAKGRTLGGALPERSVLEALAQLGGTASIPELAQPSGLSAKEVGQALRWLRQKGWVEQNGRQLQITACGEASLGQPTPDEQLIALLGKAELLTPAEVAEAGIELEPALALLKGRSGVVDERRRIKRWVRLTEAGFAALQAGALRSVQQANQLTSEMLRNGSWRAVNLRPYDVTLSAEATYAAKRHPIVRVMQQARRVFLEMGFCETVSPYVESGFWDFDALFQPQDHPARDMQDTFYVARPARAKLPKERFVRAVQATHEDGGDTGSLGWRYAWHRERAWQTVLRTHTTASTIRSLAANPTPPRKVFCVGPVFRRETVDYKHLPVFHQVEGIILDPTAGLAHLLGTLKAFYQKMGFSRFQFRPAFFPYTEPSVEVFVWSQKKSDWVEMGGSGVFRPEVTQPLGCNCPVLAWGLGLERLAMFRYELGSIGELYRSRMSWLRETPLCR